MREIKFRVWHEDIKLMNYNSVVIGIDGWQNNEQNGMVLMQFTGLKDKNGVEIYEGDIVSTTQEDKYKFVGEIIFDSGAFCVKICDRPNKCFSYDIGDTPPIYDFAKIEVIGNIYEPHH